MAHSHRLVTIHFETAIGYDRFAIPLEAHDRPSDDGCYRVCLNHLKASCANLGSSTLATGFVYIGCLINIPIRTQVVNQKGSVAAGLRLLPLMGLCAFGSAFGGAIQSKKNLCSYTLVAASMFLVAGAAILSTLDRSVRVQPRQWAGECLVGLGVGMTLSTVTILSSLKVQMRDHGEYFESDTSSACSRPQASVKRLLRNPEPWVVSLGLLLAPSYSIAASIKTSILTLLKRSCTHCTPLLPFSRGSVCLSSNGSQVSMQQLSMIRYEPTCVLR